jgi:hypothetical protein
MFRGSSGVKKNFAATDPVRRAREASGLFAALCLFSTGVPFKNLDFVNEKCASFHSDLSD